MKMSSETMIPNKADTFINYKKYETSYYSFRSVFGRLLMLYVVIVVVVDCFSIKSQSL